MINIEKLNSLKQGFVYLSRLLDYPTGSLLTDDFVNDFKTEYSETPSKKKLLNIIYKMQRYSLEELKTHYVSLFELNNRYTLYMSYYKMTDSRQRGQLLAKLKMLYEMFGVRIDGTEMSDYLPLMLEFLAFSDWKHDDRQQDLKLLFSVIEDGTFNLLENSKVQSEDMYFEIIKIVRAEFKSCLEENSVQEEGKSNG
ncbi:nitrate reductase molybdenum cofactor assembly chaperone [Companilactobacillus keshanensis]|uniref:Nitrate reductase molybdenum cofactor assembly chaperone n=1 Tax=Companilactobacillus keshanensis TaxID=2486003 RepID=A0ABW4BV75_9LACO|nr:nitrate reductase molybdenum cofactor assembly chaperone [Companilactobacillus keshanensis]